MEEAIEVMVDTEVMEVMVIARERLMLSQVTEATVIVDMEALEVMVDTEAMEVMVIARERWKLSQVIVIEEAMEVIVDTEVMEVMQERG